MSSIPRYTSKAEGFRTAEEIEALRPIVEPRPRAPRKPGNPALRQVTNGIVCFCGERFGESQALEFMLHLRAEVGEVLAWRERRLDQMRRLNAERDKDPDYQAKRSARATERYRTDPEYRERRLAWQRQRAAERWANDPAYRERQNRKKREQRARKKAEASL